MHFIMTVYSNIPSILTNSGIITPHSQCGLVFAILVWRHSDGSIFLRRLTTMLSVMTALPFRKLQIPPRWRTHRSALSSSGLVEALQYWSLLNWQNLRLHCGCVAVPVNWIFDIISSFFAKFKNVVHSLKPSETPSNSASNQAPNYVQCF